MKRYATLWILCFGIAGLTLEWGSLNCRATGQIPMRQRLPGAVRGPDLPAVELIPLGQGIRGHGSVVARDRLYLLGGSHGILAEPETSAKIVSASIGFDGTLGSWRVEPPLPRPLCGIAKSTVVWGDDVIIVAGGATAGWLEPPFSADVFLGRLGEDGRINGWEPAPPLPGPAIADTALVLDSRRVFALGGMDESRAARAEVFTATISTTGTLGGWIACPPLPQARMGHQAFLAADKLYVIGGRGAPDAPPVRDVWIADLSADGMPGEWRRQSRALILPASDGLGCYHWGRLYCFAGLTHEDKPLQSVQYAFAALGQLSPWVKLSIFWPAVRDGSLALDAKRHAIYVTGGSLVRKPFEPSQDVLRIPLEADFFSDPTSPETLHIVDSDTTFTMPETKVDFELPAPLPRFQAAEQAFEEARRRQRPLLLYFYSAENDESMRLRTGILGNRRFLRLMMGIVLGEADLEENAALAARAGVTTAPAFVVYDDDGRLVRTDTSARTLEEFARLVHDVR